jgi:hypothetical protein
VEDDGTSVEKWRMMEQVHGCVWEAERRAKLFEISKPIVKL